MIKKYLLICFMFIFLANSVYSIAKPENFINYTTELIFKDCIGKDIIKTENGYVETFPSDSFTISELESYLRVISKFRFKEHNLDSEFLYEDGPEGRGVIKCGDHVLDIFGTNYYWDGYEIIPPTKLEQTSITQNSFIKIGDISLSLLGGISLISISFISITVLAIGGFILYLKKYKSITINNQIITFSKKKSK